MTAPATEREQFEAWHQLNYPQQFSRFFDTYENPDIRKRWQGWQARAALSAPVSPIWISVDERLPKPNVDVLAVMRGKTKRSKPRIITAAIEPSDGSWYELYGDDVEYPITHWQPMPAAPAPAGPVEGAPK